MNITQLLALGIASMALVSAVFEAISCTREDIKENFYGSGACDLLLANMGVYMIAVFVLVLASAYEFAFASARQGVRGLQMLAVLVVAAVVVASAFGKYHEYMRRKYQVTYHEYMRRKSAAAINHFE